MHLHELTDASECTKLAFLIQCYPRAGQEPVLSLMEFEDNISHEVLLDIFLRILKENQVIFDKLLAITPKELPTCSRHSVC